MFGLGVSSAQLDTPERGFSFRFDAELDMRFGLESELTAYEIVNHWPQSRLKQIISAFGGEPRARRVARGIVNNRRIETARELADIVSKSLNWPVESRNHPATRTFQTLRMAVNSEIMNLERGLSGAVKALARGGRLVVISYHSAEDRVVKNFVRDDICVTYGTDYTAAEAAKLEHGNTDTTIFKAADEIVLPVPGRVRQRRVALRELAQLMRGSSGQLSWLV